MKTRIELTIKAVTKLTAAHMGINIEACKENICILL